MDLTEIRARVMAKSKLKDVFAVDDAINQAQRQYLQPIAVLPGLAHVNFPAQRSVVLEANALDVTNKIYTASYSPFLPGSVQVYVGGTLRATDDVGYVHTITNETGIVTFAAAQASVMVSYTVENSVKLTAIASDLYQIATVKWISSSNRYTDIPQLPPFDADSSGIRLYNDRIYLQGYSSALTLAIQYWRLLIDLGTATGQVQTPVIGLQWHDLYWQGALMVMEPEQYGAMFFAALDAYKRDRIREITPPGGRMKPVRW